MTCLPTRSRGFAGDVASYSVFADPEQFEGDGVSGGVTGIG